MSCAVATPYPDLVDRLADGPRDRFQVISNGDPKAKFSYFRSNALANKENLRLAAFKFGYADIDSGALNAVQLGYQDADRALASSWTVPN